MISNAAAARTRVGASLGEMSHEQLSRIQIAWYLVASYDRNPIHVDEPFAVKAGFPSVVGQGMIPMGFLAARLADEVGAHRVRAMGADFLRPIYPGDQLVTDAIVESSEEVEGGTELTWRLAAKDLDGTVRLRGWARTFHEESGR